MIRSSILLCSISSIGWPLFWPRLARSKENNRSASQFARGQLESGIVGNQFGQRDARLAGRLKRGKDQGADLLHVRGGKGTGQCRGHDPSGRIERETSGRQAHQTGAGTASG